MIFIVAQLSSNSIYGIRDSPFVITKTIPAQALTSMTAVENNYTPHLRLRSRTAITVIPHTITITPCALTHGEKGDPEQRRVKLPI